jgi:hypothetical protein
VESAVTDSVRDGSFFNKVSLVDKALKLSWTLRDLDDRFAFQHLFLLK